MDGQHGLLVIRNVYVRTTSTVHFHSFAAAPAVSFAAAPAVSRTSGDDVTVRASRQPSVQGHSHSAIVGNGTECPVWWFNIVRIFISNSIRNSNSNSSNSSSQREKTSEMLILLNVLNFFFLNIELTPNSNVFYDVGVLFITCLPWTRPFHWSPYDG